MKITAQAALDLYKEPRNIQHPVHARLKKKIIKFDLPGLPLSLSVIMQYGSNSIEPVLFIP